LSLAALLPANLDPLIALALIFLSLVTSAITATFGIGGGALMIAAILMVMPPAAAVPVHGLVQLGSNTGRALMMWAHAQWRFTGWFVLGSIPGAFAGAGIASLLPGAVLTAIIACFLLWTAWAPQPKANVRGKIATVLAGFGTAVLGMMTGVGGPLVAAFLRFLPDRRQIIATHAVLMTVQNALKAVAFSALGFAFAPYLPLVIAMIASGAVGTLIGGRLLSSLPEGKFRLGFKIVLTLVALNLLRDTLF
jgi:uncharacterized membrane protein YfcA